MEEILHQLGLVYPVIYQFSGFIYLRSFSSRDFLHNQQLLICFNAQKTTMSFQSFGPLTHRGIWTELASWMGSSLRTSCNATSWTPFSEGRRSRGNMDRDSWLMTDVGGILTWWGCFRFIANLNKRHWKPTWWWVVVSFVSPTNCTLTDCGVFLWY